MDDASKLRGKADTKNHKDYDSAVSKIVKKLYTKAEKAAAEGQYSVDVYDDDNNDLCYITSHVIEAMKKHGFKVSYHKDEAYSNHAGTAMFYFRIKW